MAKQRRVLTLKEKMDFINTLEQEKISVRELAKRFDIGKSQAADISRKRQIIRSQWESGAVNINQKKNFLNCNGAIVDRKCFEWYSIARSKNIPISGPIIKAKAKEIAEKIGYNDFAGSDGWLQKFRKRHCISMRNNFSEEIVFNAVDHSHVDISALMPVEEVFVQNYAICPSDDEYDNDSREKSEQSDDTHYNMSPSSCKEDDKGSSKIVQLTQGKYKDDTSSHMGEEKDPDKISSYKEALEQIDRLKTFSEGDFTAVELLKFLKKYFAKQMLLKAQTK